MKKWIKGWWPSKKKVKSDNSQIKQSKILTKQQGVRWTSAQAEIVNQLINMDSLIKIGKHLNQQQQAMLCQINQILCQQTIDLNQTRKSLIGGLEIINQQKQLKYTTKQLPYQYYSVRSLLWKVSIGYLESGVKQKWISFMQKNLSLYRKFILQFIIQPIEKKLGITTHNDISQYRKTISYDKIKDHPLSFSHQSKWAHYFKDVQVWKSIQKDTKRTRKNCRFFDEQHRLQLQNNEIVLKSQQLTFTQKNEQKQTYADSLTRIIFIYLKNHPNEVYCQGMNELAAIIYYCLTNKNSEYFRRVSQSDAYFIFEIVMSRLPKKHFQKGEEYVKDFIQIMKKIDFRLYEQIQKNKVENMIKLVTMKWFLSGFLTQFTIDQCLLIWDTFITWPVQQAVLTDCFTYMALALVHLNRQKIMTGENVALIFSKITNSTTQITEKTQSLYKVFPKVLEK